MVAQQQIQSYTDHIIDVEQRLLTASLLENGEVVCIVLDSPDGQRKRFLEKGHETFYVKTQPNAYTYYLKGKIPAT